MNSTTGSRSVLERGYAGPARASGASRRARGPLGHPKAALAGTLALVMMMSALASPVLARTGGVRGLGRWNSIPRSERRAVGAVECPSCTPLGKLDPENFSRPTRINNRWLPLEPGTQLTLQGQANRGGGLLPHNVIFTVTDLVKRINGIPCVVVWDQDINQGELRESELAFFAQDDDGNVWNTGEYPEEYEGGIFIGAENTWIHGIEWADAGVTIQDRPRLGTSGYLEAIAPENDFWDCGMVYAMSKDRDSDRNDKHGKAETICVPFDCYKDWVVIKEWDPIEGCGIIQLKTYARGVGVVQVGAIDDPEGETLTLVGVKRLNEQEMLAARTSALELDARGYTANEIYAQTEPAQVALRKGRLGENASLVAEAAPAPVAPPRTFMRIGPNPVTTSAAIAYGVTQAGPVDLAIYDIAGRMIRSIVKEVSPAGTYRVEWNTLDDAGRAVSAGIYFARLRTPTQAIGKMVVVSR